jgi:hypothetical protein
MRSEETLVSDWPGRVRRRANGHRQRAAALQSQRVVDQGSVDAVALEGLIDAVLADPMRIGPSIGSLIAFVAGVDEKERQRRQLRGLGGQEGIGYADPRAPIGLRLTWRAGAIVPGESGVFVPEAGPSWRA